MPRHTAVGTAFFRINGVQYQLAGEMKLNPLSEKRTAEVGIDGSVTPKVEPVAPFIECAVRDRADVDPIPLHSMWDETVTVELTNGTVWTLSNAFYTGDGDLDGKEGTHAVRFHGTKMRRLRTAA
jgi:hypothetical protein